MKNLHQLFKRFNHLAILCLLAIMIFAFPATSNAGPEPDFTACQFTFNGDNYIRVSYSNNLSTLLPPSSPGAYLRLAIYLNGSTTPIYATQYNNKFIANVGAIAPPYNAEMYIEVVNPPNPVNYSLIYSTSHDDPMISGNCQYQNQFEDDQPTNEPMTANACFVPGAEGTNTFKVTVSDPYFIFYASAMHYEAQVYITDLITSTVYGPFTSSYALNGTLYYDIPSSIPIKKDACYKVELQLIDPLAVSNPERSQFYKVDKACACDVNKECDASFVCLTGDLYNGNFSLSFFSPAGINTSSESFVVLRGSTVIYNAAAASMNLPYGTYTVCHVVNTPEGSQCRICKDYSFSGQNNGDDPDHPHNRMLPTVGKSNNILVTVTNSKVNFMYDADQAESIDYVIYNIQGQTITTKRKIAVGKGENVITEDKLPLIPGIYFIKIAGAHQNKTTKFLIQ